MKIVSVDTLLVFEHIFVQFYCLLYTIYFVHNGKLVQLWTFKDIQGINKYSITD